MKERHPGKHSPSPRKTDARNSSQAECRTDTQPDRTSAPTQPRLDTAGPGDMRDYLATHERRRRLAPRAILVGILAGLTAVAFRKASTWRMA